MEKFHEIAEGAVILRLKGGIFKQVKVARRGKDVFAVISGGFLKLHGNTGTANPNISWHEIEAEGVSCDRAGGQPGWTE